MDRGEIRFGPAGNGEGFAAAGHKKTLEAPDYVRSLGLTAYEYQCGRGVRIKEEAAQEFGERARAAGIMLSLHAPYYISLSGAEEEKRLGSLRYIRESAAAALAMGADRVIVHSGSCAKMGREAALELAKDTLRRALCDLQENGLAGVSLCPETMGKVNQLGTLAEVLELCKLDESLIPCIDFGHLNARTQGGITGAVSYREILDEMENALGRDRAAVFHSHFSKIEYTKSGEKRHLTFADELYGPMFEPLAEELYRRGYTPTIICESAGTQDVDAQWMKQYFESLR